MVITCSLLAYIDDVSYLGQNFPSYDVCLFRAPHREASGASMDSHCAGHSCGVKRNGHARWKNIVKKVIFKILSVFSGASGKWSFRNKALIGCADTSWSASPSGAEWSFLLWHFPLSEVRGLQLPCSYRHWSGVSM